MSKQLKDILGMMIIVIPLFVLLFFGWLHSPMYEREKLDRRIAAQHYLLQNYYYDTGGPNRKALIEKYDFKEDEITPVLFLKKYNSSVNEGRTSLVDNN